MKPACHQIAEPAYVEEWLQSMKTCGFFEISLPLNNPHMAWPAEGDMIALHMRGSNVTMMAFVRRVAPGAKEPDGVPRLHVTAGYRPKPLGQLTHCPSSLKP